MITRNAWRTTTPTVRPEPLPHVVSSAPADPERQADQHARHPEQHHGDARGRAVRAVREAPPDVQLHHARGVAGAARREHVDVVEHPRQHRDDLDHGQQLDDRPDLGDQHAPLQAPPAGSVDPGRLGRLGWQREQRGREHDDARSRAAARRRGRPTETIARCEFPSQSCARKPTCASRKRRVENTVLLQEVGERDSDRRRRQHVRQEHDGLVLAGAADPVVQHERHREPEPEHDRHAQEQLQVVDERLPELRVVDDAAVVVEADPDGRVERPRVEALTHDLYERKGEREPEREHRGQHVQVGPERPPPAWPAADVCSAHSDALARAQLSPW